MGKMRSIAAEQYKAYVNELKIKYPHLAAFKTVDPAEFMAQRRRIPADVVVVSYLVTEREMSVFVVMRDTIFIKDIPIDRALLQENQNFLYASCTIEPLIARYTWRKTGDYGPNFTC